MTNLVINVTIKFLFTIDTLFTEVSMVTVFTSVTEVTTFTSVLLCQPMILTEMTLCIVTSV